MTAFLVPGDKDHAPQIWRFKRMIFGLVNGSFYAQKQLQEALATWPGCQGIKNFTAAEAVAQGVKDSEHSTNDLYNAIKEGNYPSWNWFVQAMPEKDAATYKFDVFDITKVWPHSDYPLIPVGKITLNRNPTNYHAETE